MDYGCFGIALILIAGICYSKLRSYKIISKTTVTFGQKVIM